MKTSNKSNIITGAVLLIMAALFSISLVLQLFNFGAGGPGHDNLFFMLGQILYTVYGFSSLLIPTFLLITGLSCFATKWTAKRTVRLLTAIVPFYTAVITENICRSILKLQTSSFTIAKLIISIVIGLMLIVIEYLFAGIISDKVNDSYYKITKKERPVPQNPEETTKDNETIDQNSKKTRKSVKLQKSDEKSEEIEINDTEKNDEKSQETPFDAALSTLKLSNSSQQTSEKEEETTENFEENKEDNEPVTPATILTQEEYAALIQPVEETSEEEETNNLEESIPDELEWNNLPKKPDVLPPEYDENYNPEIQNTQSDTTELSTQIFEDDDPALEFPPKENFLGEEVNQYDEDSEAFSQDDETYSKELDISNDDFITQASDLESELLSDIQNESTSSSLDNPDDDFVSFEVEPSDEPPIKPFENQEIHQNQTKISTENPSPKKYEDTVVENPSYPHKIVIHNDDENPQTPKEQPVEEKNKPKYPNKIKLSDDETPVETPEPSEKPLSHLLVSKPNYNQINGIQKTSQSSNQVKTQTPNQVKPQTLNQNPSPKSSVPASPKIDPDFFDVNVNDDPEVVAQKVHADEQKKSLLQRAQERHEMLLAQNAKEEQEKTQQNHSFSSFASDVFDDMEADIRKNNGFSEKNINSDPESDELSEAAEFAYASEMSEPTETLVNKPAKSPVKDTTPKLESEPQGPALSANDLTSDDLSAFFNAQEEENTPQTQEIQGNLPVNNRAAKKGPYVIPSDLLTAYKDDQYWLIDDETKKASLNLTQTLKEFNIEASIIGIKKGPVVTMFELLPAPGVKLSKIVTLQDNIALSLAASSVRIVAPIPGKQAVGIEVPNKNRSIVSFREIIEMPLPEWEKMAVPVILGKDILGKPQLVDLVKTPHMLIAGATGSGKSVCVNSLILSILYKRSYKDVKLILVDPKVVELKLYNNIPHLLTPVITEPKKAFQALQYCLCEMERRYALLDGLGVRDISTYNQRIKERNIATEKLPYIVVIIDEFADLMATTGRELEQVVARLTAMSRAVGIHLVLATQRPSVNVITGLIKANIPTRIAFMVASRTDSNIIIDSVGAEKLLGRGDMLYASAVDPNPIRIQGTYVNDTEVENVVDYVKQFGTPDYIDDEIFVDDEEDDNENVDLFGNSIDEDPLYDQALEIVVQAGKASASYIQRRLKIGYNRAARLVEEMEERGIVGPANGSKPREIIHIP